MSFMSLRRFFVLFATPSFLLLGLLWMMEPAGAAAEGVQPAATSTVVSGTLAANTTWTVAASPYVITDDLTVAVGAKLTIQPGVEVQIAENRRITINGALDAKATAISPITFTSFNNNMWYSLIFAPGSSGILEHVWMAHGGLLTADGMVSIASNDVTVRNSVFTYGGQDYNDALLFVRESSPVIEGNEFSNSSAIGIRVEGYDDNRPLLLRNNRFSNTPDVAVHVTMREEEQGLLFEGNTSSGKGWRGARIGDGGFDRSPYQGIISGTVAITGQSDFPILVESPYLVTVPEGTKLILAAGTVVKLSNERIDVRGALVTNGTADKPVIFTSLHDDTRGGDTNADGAASQPAAGDWRNIIFDANAKGSVLQHTWIGYGGNGSAEGMVVVQNSDLILDHVTLAHGATEDATDQDAALRIEQASPTIRNSSFISNTYWAIQWNGFDQNKPVVFEDNRFVGNGTGAVWAMLDREDVDVTLRGNSSRDAKFNGFMLTDMNAATPGIAGSVTLSGQIDFPFIVGSGPIGTGIITRNLTIGPNGQLTLPAGTLLKHNTCIEVYGRLTAEGDAANPIVMTSIHDDSMGSNRTGDGATAIPVDERSGGVRFRAGSQGTLRYMQIHYGGGCGNEDAIDVEYRSFVAANLLLESDDVVVQQSIFSGAGPADLGMGVVISAASPRLIGNEIYTNSRSGLQILGAGAQPVVDGNRIYANGAAGIHLKNVHTATPLVRNEIFNNVGAGVYGEGNSVAVLRRNRIENNQMGAMQESVDQMELDANFNYWGSVLGPHHTTKNPQGAGDGVSDNVIFETWLAGFPGYEVYVPTLRNRLAGIADYNVYVPMLSR